MRFLLLLTALLAVAVVIATPIEKSHKNADKAFLEKQKQILRLFRHLKKPTYYKEFVETAKNYKPEDNLDKYTKPEVVKHFLKHISYTSLPTDAIFSIFNEAHAREAEDLFKFLYYAKDFDTFFKSALWARQHINQYLYIYSLSVAIVHRDDTYGIVLPPIYELIPHYFFGNDVIYEAQKLKQIHQRAPENGFIINANYSGWYLNLHPEQSLSYFTEDVGLNAYYYYSSIYYPTWLKQEDFNYDKDKRGEIFYYLHQQLLARYYLERLSNDFGEIEYFNWELPFPTEYQSSLIYPNGLQFPSRPKFAKLYEYFYNYGQSWNYRSFYGYSYTEVVDTEHRINDAIDKGFVYNTNGEKINLYTTEGFNVLGNIIEGNADSPNQRYYGFLQSFARHLLGYAPQPLDHHRLVPSALEHYETSLRDPAFYQLFKRITLLFQHYKYQLPAYTEKDLAFPGVKITNIELDRLITYFDYFFTDLAGAVFYGPDEQQSGTDGQNSNNFYVRVRQQRLNHKPFTYKIHVDSDKDQWGSVRVYLGPKYDEYGRTINISQNLYNFVQLDHFKYRLKSGKNTILRNSYQSYFYQRDRTTYKDLYKKVQLALDGNEDFPLDGSEAFLGIPARFLLPKGNYQGQEFEFYVIVSPYLPYDTDKTYDHDKYYYPKLGSGALFVDAYPLGYPFDRHINYEQLFYNLPNSYFHTTKIYHRHADDINASNAQN